MSAFVPDSANYVQWEKRWDSDGTVWLQVQAHGDLTAKTPYGIVADEYGWISQALPAANKYIYVGVPPAAVDQSETPTCWLQIGGDVDDMITASLSVSVGHGLTVNTGAIADIGADFSGAAGEFAVCRTASTTSTTQDVKLVPERIITI